MEYNKYVLTLEQYNINDNGETIELSNPIVITSLYTDDDKTNIQTRLNNLLFNFGIELNRTFFNIGGK